MDGLKLIPQVFFDLIGRVVPGAAGIVAALLLSRTTWESWLRGTFGVSVVPESSLSAIFVFWGAAYVVGQFISPLAKLVQRIGELDWLKLEPQAKVYDLLRWLKPERQKEVYDWLCSLKPKPKAEGYDWLRLHHPEAGAHCAKIRAEFTMHNGLAVVLLSSAIVYVIRGEVWQWSVLAGLIAAGLLAAYRGRETRDTFNETVKNFEEAAGFDNQWC